MYRVELQVDNDITELASELLAQAPRRVQRAISRATRPIETAALERLQTQPGPPSYPIRWKSERQRRAFFATNGFGRGIPTKRTGEMSAAWRWESTRTREGLRKSLVNPTDYVEFVQGDNAQPFHLDTGWVQAAPVFVQAEADIGEAMIDVLVMLDDELG